MAEGMNVELAHKLSEREKADRQKHRWEEAVEIVEVLFLAIAAIATAWSGYQAAEGEGHQSVLYGEAMTDQFHAGVASNLGGSGWPRRRHVQRLAAGPGRQEPAACGGVRSPVQPRLPQRLCSLVEDGSVHQPGRTSGPGYMPQYRNTGSRRRSD